MPEVCKFFNTEKECYVSGDCPLTSRSTPAWLTLWLTTQVKHVSPEYAGHFISFDWRQQSQCSKCSLNYSQCKHVASCGNKLCGKRRPTDLLGTQPVIVTLHACRLYNYSRSLFCQAMLGWETPSLKDQVDLAPSINQPTKEQHPLTARVVSWVVTYKERESAV